LSEQDELQRQLRRLEERLRDGGDPVVDLLAPGLEREDVRETLSSQFGAAPEELVTWFCWHNGIVPGEHLALHTVLISGTPMSLAQALRIASRRRQEEPSRTWWPRGWLPLIDHIGSWCELVAQCDDVRFASLFSYRYGQPPEAPFAPSLARMVDAWHTFLDLGYRWDPARGHHDVDGSKISKELARQAGFDP
jgi:hypothetical protein